MFASQGVQKSFMGARLLGSTICLVAAPLVSQGISPERILCEPGKCRLCTCVEDRLEVIFDSSGSSVLELEEPQPGDQVDASVFIIATSPSIQSWSYGVAHDQERASIQEVTFEGTDAKSLFRQGFLVLSKDDIITCKEPSDTCDEEEPGGGFVQVCVLSLTENITLPAGRNRVSRARYKLLDRPAAEAPIVLHFSDRMTNKGSAPISIHFTDNGNSTQPRVVSDGWIVGSPRSSFHRGDPDGDGRVSVLDSVSILLFLFLSGPAPSCLEAADFDDNGRIDGMDPILIRNRPVMCISTPAPGSRESRGHEKTRWHPQTAPESGTDPGARRRIRAIRAYPAGLC